MFFDDKGTDFSAGRDRKSNTAIAGFDFHYQGSQHVDAKRLAALPVFGVTRHGGGDMVVDPVTLALVMVVGPAATHRERAYVPDGWHCHVSVSLVVVGATV